MIRVSSIAIHEAGHTVVAAFLHLPFTSVSIRPDRVSGGRVTYQRINKWITSVRVFVAKGDAFVSRTEADIQSITGTRKTNLAVVTLAARAAVDSHRFTGEVSEDDYKYDEENLRQVADALAVPAIYYDAWRYELLERAQEIVSIPYVAQAIRLVAVSLEREYEATKRGIPAKKVRDTLLWAKMHQSQKTRTDTAEPVHTALVSNSYERAANPL